METVSSTTDNADREIIRTVMSNMPGFFASPKSLPSAILAYA